MSLCAAAAPAALLTAAAAVCAGAGALAAAGGSFAGADSEEQALKPTEPASSTQHANASGRKRKGDMAIPRGRKGLRGVRPRARRAASSGGRSADSGGVAGSNAAAK